MISDKDLKRAEMLLDKADEFIAMRLGFRLERLKLLEFLCSEKAKCYNEQAMILLDEKN